MTKKDPITQLCVSISNKYPLRTNQATYRAAEPQPLENVSNFLNAKSSFFFNQRQQMNLKKLTLKPATIPGAKRVSKPLPLDAEGHIIRPLDVQGNLIVRTLRTTKKNSQIA